MARMADGDLADMVLDHLEVKADARSDI